MDRDPRMVAFINRRIKGTRPGGKWAHRQPTEEEKLTRECMWPWYSGEMRGYENMKKCLNELKRREAH